MVAADAADRLRALRDHVDDLHRLLPEFEVRRLAGEERLAAEQRLKRLQDHPQDGGFALPDTDPRVIAAQRDLKNLTAETRRLTDNYERKVEAWRAASATLANVESWLSGGKPSGVMLRDHADETPKLSKDTDVLTFVELQRRRVRELRADLNRIASSPFPSAYCKQRMREQITALAERGRPSVPRLVEHTATWSLPMNIVRCRSSRAARKPRHHCRGMATARRAGTVPWLHVRNCQAAG